jgi:hypothetical protein
LDGVHEHIADVRGEILAELGKFAVHGHCEESEEWWARRSKEADMVIRFRVEPTNPPGG